MPQVRPLQTTRKARARDATPSCSCPRSSCTTKARYASVVSGAFAIYLAWNLWQLRTLDFWLQHRSVADPPDAMGLWGDVVAQVVRLHRRKRFHKERLTRLFRELRRSTGDETHRLRGPNCRQRRGDGGRVPAQNLYGLQPRRERLTVCAFVGVQHRDRLAIEHKRDCDRSPSGRKPGKHRRRMAVGAIHRHRFTAAKHF